MSEKNGEKAKEIVKKFRENERVHTDEWDETRYLEQRIKQGFDQKDRDHEALIGVLVGILNDCILLNDGLYSFLEEIVKCPEIKKRCGYITENTELRILKDEEPLKESLAERDTSNARKQEFSTLLKSGLVDYSLRLFFGEKSLSLKDAQDARSSLKDASSTDITKITQSLMTLFGFAQLVTALSTESIKIGLSHPLVQEYSKRSGK